MVGPSADKINNHNYTQAQKINIDNVDGTVNATHYEQNQRCYHFERTGNEIEAEVSKIQSEMAKNLQEALYTEALTKKLQTNQFLKDYNQGITAGSSQSMGQQMTNIITQIFLKPVLSIGFEIWEENQPEDVKQRNQKMKKLQSVMQNLENFYEQKNQKDKNSWQTLVQKKELIEDMKKELAEHEVLFEKYDKIHIVEKVTLDFLDGVIIQGQSMTGHIPKHVYSQLGLNREELIQQKKCIPNDKIEEINISQIVPHEFYQHNKQFNREKLIEEGKCIPLKIMYEKMLDKLIVDTMNQRFEYLDKKQKREVKFLEKKHEVKSFSKDLEEMLAKNPPNLTKEIIETSAAVGCKAFLVGTVLAIGGTAILEFIKAGA